MRFEIVRVGGMIEILLPHLDFMLYVQGKFVSEKLFLKYIYIYIYILLLFSVRVRVFNLTDIYIKKDFINSQAVMCKTTNRPPLCYPHVL